MTVMPVPSLLPRGRPLTYDDLAELPDDGHRHELIDGTLLVTPAPAVRHQAVCGELYALLREGLEPGLRVFFAPVDLRLAEDTVLQPDLIVVREADLGPRAIEVTPLLAVEVLSPSTRLVDLNLKKARYEQAQCPSYWVVDPETLTFIAWELRQGTYVEVARAEADGEVRLDRPFRVVVRPGDLAGGVPPTQKEP